jgi:hypothetical protein
LSFSRIETVPDGLSSSGLISAERLCDFAGELDEKLRYWTQNALFQRDDSDWTRFHPQCDR